VHRALEWSVCKSYGELQNILDQDQGGYPRWECPTGADWLAQTIRRAAEIANEHYETCIDHYDLAEGTRNPLRGLDQTLKDCLAQCLGYAVVGLARIIERLVDEAQAVPPFVDVTLQGIVAAAKMPYRVLAKQFEDVREREALRLIYDEFERTGKVVQNLPPDDAEVRRQHAEEVLRTSLTKLNAQPIRPPGQAHGQGAAKRIRSRRTVTTVSIVPEAAQEAKPDKPRRTERLTLYSGVENPLERSMSIQEILTIASSKPPISELGLPRPEPISLPKILAPPVASPKAVAAPVPAPLPAPPTPVPTPAPLAAVDRPVEQKVPAKSVVMPPPEPISIASAAEIDAPALPSQATATLREPTKPIPPPPQERPKVAAEKAPAPVPEEKKKAPAKAKPKEPAQPELKFYLDRGQPIVNAPSIGNKTAEKMRAAGVKTVGELLASHPEKLAAKLDTPHIVPDVIRQWQAEATLVCRVPGLRGHDAQILVACGIDQPAELAECEPAELLELIQPFVDSSDGKRVLRGGTPPDLDEVAEWIEASQQARSLKA
jgi:hypothetical protein